MVAMCDGIAYTNYGCDMEGQLSAERMVGSYFGPIYLNKKMLFLVICC